MKTVTATITGSKNHRSSLLILSTNLVQWLPRGAFANCFPLSGFLSRTRTYCCAARRELRLNPGLETAFQLLGLLLPLQAAATVPKNAAKSVSGSASLYKHAQNVAR